MAPQTAPWHRGRHHQCGTTDAMYLAGLIPDDAKITKKNLQTWIEGAVWGMVAEFTVLWVASASPHVREMALKWIESKNAAIALAGWQTYTAWSPSGRVGPGQEFCYACANTFTVPCVQLCVDGGGGTNQGTNRMTEHDDPRLVQGLRAGRREACAELVRNHYERVYRFLVHLTRDCHPAAIAARLDGRDVLKSHPDPVVGGPFEYIALDGGFELRSKVKGQDDKPLVLTVGRRER